MANRRSRREAIRDVASYIAQRVVAAAFGVAIYFGLARFIVIEQQDQIASAFFTIAGVVGVVAGFLGAAVFFVAGASGPSIERIRSDHGQNLNTVLLGTMAILMASAFGAVACGLFSNGYGAKAAMTGILTLIAYEVAVLGLALAVALKAENERPIPERETYPPQP